MDLHERYKEESTSERKKEEEGRIHEIGRVVWSVRRWVNVERANSCIIVWVYGLSYLRKKKKEIQREKR